jgi:hypothetical protein
LAPKEFGGFLLCSQIALRFLQMPVLRPLSTRLSLQCGNGERNGCIDKTSNRRMHPDVRKSGARR